MTMRTVQSRLVVLLCIAIAVTAAPAAQSKRPLTHEDFDGWRTIYTPTLTRDGRYLAYSFMPQDGDGELVVRDLRTVRSIANQPVRCRRQ